VPPIYLSTNYTFEDFGQPLPQDDDLRKDKPDGVPAEARRMMEALGIDWENLDD